VFAIEDTLADIEETNFEDIQELACLLYDDYSTFDLRPMASDAGYSSGSLHWNMCREIVWSDTSYPSREDATFAYLVDGSNVYPLTTEEIIAYPTTEVLYTPCTQAMIDQEEPACFKLDEGDAASVVNGIAYTFESETVCPYNTAEEVKFSFRVNVVCDEAFADVGEGQVDSVSGTNTCEPTVNMRHSAGCPMFSALGMVNWLSRNSWLTGIILLFVGAFVALAGNKYFAHVMGVFAGLTAFTIVIVLSSLFGWLATTAGVIIFIIVGLLAGAGLGYLMFKMKTASFVLLGLAGGWFAGSWFTAFVFSISGWESMWWLILFTILFMALGGYMAYKYHEKLLMYVTSIVGSYMFMRAFTHWIGGYPSEIQMYAAIASDEEVELTYAFWIYCVVFAIASFGSYKFQKS
jgi:hypothetical protein